MEDLDMILTGSNKEEMDDNSIVVGLLIIIVTITMYGHGLGG